MNLKRYTISNLFIYTLIFGFLFIVQHIQVFGDNPFLYLSTPQLIVSSIFLISISIILYLYERKSSGLKLNIPLIITLSILFIIMLITTFLYPSETIIYLPTNYNMDIPATVMITEEMRVLFIAVNFFALLIVYVVLDILPKKIRCIKQLDIIFVLLTLFSIVSIIFSLITEMDKYSLFFTNPSGEVNYHVQSFTLNPNNFGIILLFGIISCLYLFHNHKKIYFYIIALILFLFMIPTYSRTNILSAAVIFLLYFLFRCIVTYKEHVKRNSITLAIVLTPILVFFISYLIYLGTGKSFDFILFKRLDTIFESIVQKEDMNSRLVIWKSVVNVLNQGYWIAGLGFGLFSGVFLQCLQQNNNSGWQSDSAHNGVLQILGDGGIILLILFIIAFAYLVYAMVKIYKRHKNLVFLNIAVICGVLVHMIFEGSTPLIVSTPCFEYIILSIITFVPTLSIYYHDCHNKENQNFKEYYSKNQGNFTNKRDKYIISKSIMFFLTPITIILFTLMSCYINEVSLIVFSIIFSILLLFSPFIAEIVFKKKDFRFKEFLKETYIPYLCIACVYCLITILPALFVEHSILMTITLTVAPVFLYISIFMLFPYFAKKAGIICTIIEKLNNAIAKYISDGIESSENNDSKTLYEKTFKMH